MAVPYLGDHAAHPVFFAGEGTDSEDVPPSHLNADTGYNFAQSRDALSWSLRIIALARKLLASGAAVRHHDYRLPERNLP